MYKDIYETLHTILCYEDILEKALNYVNTINNESDYVNILAITNLTHDISIKIKDEIINQKYDETFVENTINYDVVSNECASIIIDTCKKIHSLLTNLRTCKSYKYLVTCSTRSIEKVINDIFKVLSTLVVDMWSLSKDVYKSNDNIFSNKYDKYKIINDECELLDTINSLKIIGTSMKIGTNFENTLKSKKRKSY